eukprot:5082010-Alexandrium_andersonii.AAC.1
MGSLGAGVAGVRARRARSYGVLSTRRGRTSGTCSRGFASTSFGALFPRRCLRLRRPYESYFRMRAGHTRLPAVVRLQPTQPAA